ncbi:MAG: crossover junction endodeoxyribonuclease RuvC [Actinomycetota bacterium]|nr:crossover junction endodeoxyribonuclease RuvC [Actinomycetota bacterium]
MLGVDPGLTRCGIAVVDGPPGRPVAVATRIVRTPRALPLECRLVALSDEVIETLRLHSPNVVACERVLFSANVRTAMGVGQAAGVVLLAAGRAGLPVASYSPNEVKRVIAGHGGADKGAVARMVAAQLGLRAVPNSPDIADALAVALCHLTRARLAGLVRRSEGVPSEPGGAAGPGGRAGQGERP